MMTKKMALAACGLLLLLVAIRSTPVAAQDAVLSEFYGSGVHHYFAGNYGQAIADLNAAIDGGSRDPRAYYFRGLAKSRLGYGGDADFQAGAALETGDSDQYYPVGKALERIQGSTRMRIERYRALARATAMAQQRRRDAQRYEQLRGREKQVLRAPVAAPAAPATAVGPTPPVAPPAAAPLPVPDPTAAVAQPAVPAAPMPEPPVAADPFAEDPAPQPAAAPPTVPADAVPKPPVADPPAAELPADEPATPPSDDDPFAEPPASDAADPSEVEPEPEMPEEDDPFAEP